MTPSFRATSTTAEVLDGVDLDGRRVLITGVSSGLGLETAQALAAHGAKVVGAVRDIDAARSAIAADTAAGSGPEIDLVECDLASLDSVRRCAEMLDERRETFDVIIANAGVMNCPFGRTVDGFETHFGTNHLGHFVLFNRLVPRIRDGGRVIALTSAAHRSADVDLDDPGFDRSTYEPFRAYGRSKTANILFVTELDRRLRDRGDRGVRGIAVQPGGIPTALLRHTTPAILEQMMAEAWDPDDGEDTAPPPVKTVEQGAATTVWAGFVAPVADVGGRYCEDCQVVGVSDGRNAGVRGFAVDPQRAQALWALSEQLVGERY